MESVPSPGSSHNGSNLQVHTYETIPKGEGSEGLGPSGTTSVEVFQLRRSGTREPGWGGFCMGHAECHGDKIPLKLMFSDPNRSSWTVLYFTCCPPEPDQELFKPGALAGKKRLEDGPRLSRTAGKHDSQAGLVQPAKLGRSSLNAGPPPPKPGDRSFAPLDRSSPTWWSVVEFARWWTGRAPGVELSPYAIDSSASSNKCLTSSNKKLLE